MKPTADTQTGGQSAPTDDHYAVVKQLFNEHNRALVNFLRARLPSEQEASDVAQEAYVKLLQLHHPGTVSFLRGYLFRIAANLSVDRARRRIVREKAAVELFEQLSDDAAAALDTQAITREQFDIACEALNELSLPQREAFVRHIVEGCGTPEIARDLGVDERTVRKYVTRALLHCRQRLGALHSGTGG